jgi:protocatechuate 3,4-dioxygenase beta subunit
MRIMSAPIDPALVTGLLLMFLPGAACAQGRLAGGPCEGCEAVFEFGDRALGPTDTLPDFGGDGPGMLLTGTIYQMDGRTPAPGVVLYVYHTDQTGVYPTRGGEEGWAGRHGYLRGWVRTDGAGRYRFYTLKPAAYPSRSNPAHVHGTLLEPDGRYYWIEEWHFAGDPLLGPDQPDESSARGSVGLVTPRDRGGLMVVERDIVLGRNVPGYRGGPDRP